MSITLHMICSLNGKSRVTAEPEGEFANLKEYRRDLSLLHRRTMLKPNSVVFTTLDTIQQNPTLWMPDKEEFPDTHLYILDWEGVGSDKFYSELGNHYSCVSVIVCASSPSLLEPVSVESTTHYMAVDPPTAYAQCEEEDEEDFVAPAVSYAQLFNEVIPKDAGSKDILVESQSEFFNTALLTEKGIPLTIECTVVPILVFPPHFEVANICDKDEAMTSNSTIEVFHDVVTLESAHVTVPDRCTHVLQFTVKKP